MGAGKGQFGLDFDHNIMTEVGVYFKYEIQSNISPWPNR